MLDTSEPNLSPEGDGWRRNTPKTGISMPVGINSQETEADRLISVTLDNLLSLCNQALPWRGVILSRQVAYNLRLQSKIILDFEYYYI